MKYLLILLILLTGCTSVPLAGKISIEDKINNKIERIESLMEKDKQDNGKYKRRDIKIGEVDYPVSEYETSKGEVGYIIYVTEETEDGIYKQIIATGVNAKNYEQDLIFTPNSTSTPL